MTPAPPACLDVERELLGTLLTYYDPRHITVIQAAGLQRDDLSRWAHQVIYAAILHLHGAGEHVETLTVSRFLGTQRDAQGVSFLDRVGGMVALEILAAHHVCHGIRERAKAIHEDALARRLLDALRDAEERARARDVEGAWRAVEAARERPALRVVHGKEAA
jgi:replicative DNA helicase